MANYMQIAEMGLEKFVPGFGKIVREGGRDGLRVCEQKIGRNTVLTGLDAAGNAVVKSTRGLSHVPVDGSVHTFRIKNSQNLETGATTSWSKDLDNGAIRISRNNGKGEVESISKRNFFDANGGRQGAQDTSYSLHNYNTNQHLNVRGHYRCDTVTIEAYGVQNGKRVDYDLGNGFAIPKGTITLDRNNSTGSFSVLVQSGNKTIEPNFADQIGKYFYGLLQKCGMARF